MLSADAPAASESDAILVEVLEGLALEAGRAIMAVRDSGVSVESKADCSPVTEADRAAEKIILAALRERYPGIPIVAEEETSAGRVPAALDGAFFLVDPLDGTKEFVNGRQDFTVNIALVRDGAPCVGVVYAPARREMCSGRPGHADAVSVSPDRKLLERRCVTVRRQGERPTIVASRSHRTPETDEFLSRFPDAEIVSIGSSLKFCMLACGSADLYPRFGRTMEWDTAAGDAVLRAAGGRTLTLEGRPLVYGKRNIPGEEDFANPYFISSAGILSG